MIFLQAYGALLLLSVPLVVLLDWLLGEPSKYHPLIGFGKLADAIEKSLNQSNKQSNWKFFRGIAAWALCVIPLVAAIIYLDQFLGGWWLTVICGWIAIGWHSLRQHGQWVVDALNAGDLETAREKVGWIVSRDTSQLDEVQISQAGIESVLENGNDAIFAALFWLIVAGAPGVVLYRASNTLDAMWGYRNPRFEQFGKFTARVDDVLNYIPARLTALSYACAGSFRTAITSWRLQAAQWYSPNAGVVMASGAGALQVTLGGSASYHGQSKHRPELGIGAKPSADDLLRAIQLIDRSVLIWVLITVLVFGLSLMEPLIKS